MVTKNSTLTILGQSVPLVHYPHNWIVNPEQTFLFDTGIFQSGKRFEQRGTALQEGELSQQLKVTYLGDGKADSNRIYNSLRGLKGKPCVIPWLPEPMEDLTPRMGSNQFFVDNTLIKYLKVRTAEVLRISKQNPTQVETSRVSSIDYDNNLVTMTQPWSLNIPGSLQLFFFCRGATLSAVKRVHNTDQTHEIDVLWSSHDDGLLP